MHVNIGTVQIENSKYSKLPGINIDSKQTFERHINRTCKTSSTKLNALSKISYYMDPLKRRLLVNAFFTSQFNYCPLTWTFHSRKWNNKINMLHERCLGLIYSDMIFSYEELLDNSNSKEFHSILYFHQSSCLLRKSLNQNHSAIVEMFCPSNEKKIVCFFIFYRQ